jgi:hypothetical protein
MAGRLTEKGLVTKQEHILVKLGCRDKTVCRAEEF